MKTIAIALQKGGTGKTVMSVSLAAALAQKVPGLAILPTAGLGGELKAWDEGAGGRKPFAMRKVIKGIAALGFRYCILDLSPGFGAIERAALVASDEVITPIMPDPFGISGLEIFTTNLQELRNDLDSAQPAYRRIIINAVDKRIKQHREIIATIQSTAEGFTLYTVPVDQVFRRAETEQQSVYQTGGAKKETVAELERLAENLMEG
jgi:chromosome partitioning protein